ncbi:MAG: galactokinase family protein, partial [Gemmatimonadota bacterium]
MNLIGDHVDYVGLPVLPVALSRRVSLLVRPRGDALVRVASVTPDFGERAFALEAEPPPWPDGDWGNYLKAAAADRVRAHAGLRGLDAVLTSEVPVAAGLSSSTALVVATAVAIEAVNGRKTPRLELAASLARAERYVGTEGGGMDQAICLGARAGHAALIEFDPLRLDHVPIPSGWRFVVADSLVRAEKSGAAREAYNDRARSCRTALARVRAALGPGQAPA